MKKNSLLFSFTLVFTFLLVNTNIAPPTGEIAPFLNGKFPDTMPGSNYELEDILPGVDFNGPLRILTIPNSDDILLLCKIGRVWRINLENKTRKLVLDITERTFVLGEAGSTGIALHPSFGDSSQPDKQEVFVFYRTKPDAEIWSDLGFNRLSRFSYDAQSETFLSDSEEILIQQYDRNVWHNGGGMVFGDDGFLYLGFGDEGPEDFKTESTQRLDGGFFSGIIRIDVDNDPSRSHPIVRQPTRSEAEPAGWGNTFSQGYSIPNNNPWLSPDGEHLEEFWAIGTRAPYVLTKDEQTGKLWLADVGEFVREEISIVEKGTNLQWPYIEGTFVSETHSKPDNIIGEERAPFYDYGRDFGTAIIGGFVYHGTKFSELSGKYLFGDYTFRKLAALTSTSENTVPEAEVLIPDFSALGVEIPTKPGFTGVFPLNNGDIMVSIMGEDVFQAGKIYTLKRKDEIPEPPALLSELDVFTDLQTLEVAPGIIPYTVNSPLWSDRAEKYRWMAIPNDGVFDEESEKIKIINNRDMKFPSGTVFIKHFELPLTDDPNGPTRKLETRFFIVDKDQKGYGVTYRWNEDETDATLLGGGQSATFDIEENGAFAFTQTWDFPSRDQCLTCHNASADFILGLKVHQLNGDLFYNSLGQEENQLVFLSELGVFDQPIQNPDRFPRSYAIDDEEGSLEERVLSYMASNCSSCHRLGGTPDLTLDLRFGVPVNFQNMVNAPTKSHASDPSRVIVKPGDHQNSELWIRDASDASNRMPPLARNIVDEPYIEALTEWIDGLSPDAGKVTESLLYPNPTTGFIFLRLRDDWTEAYTVRIFSVDGKLVFEENYTENSAQIDLNNFQKGAYIFEITTQSDREVRRVILN